MIITGVVSRVVSSVISRVLGSQFFRWLGLGDGTRYIHDFTKTLTGDFDLSFTWQRMDKTGTGLTGILGAAGSSESIRVYDSGNASPDLFLFVVAGNFRNIPNAFAGIAQGQVIRVVVKRRGIVVSLWIDGVYIGDVGGDASGDFLVENLGSYTNGTNVFNSILADVDIVDYTELPKGTYLKGDATAYGQVNIPVVSGDTVEFDYVHSVTGVLQVLFSETTSSLYSSSSDKLTFPAGFISAVTVDGVPYSSAAFTLVDGVKYNIVATMVGGTSIEGLLSSVGGANKLEGTIANFIVNRLAARLPAGDYLKGDGTAYEQVNIPVVASDVVSFDYVPTVSGANQRIVGIVGFGAGITMSAGNNIQYNAIFSSFKVDGVEVVSDTYTCADGVKIAIEAVFSGSQTINAIGSSATFSDATEGTIANFNVNNGEYIYTNKDSGIVDQGDGTALSLNSGSVAEYGGNLIDAVPPTEVKTPWIDNLDGTYSIDGSQVATASLLYSNLLTTPEGKFYGVGVVISDYVSGDLRLGSGADSTIMSVSDGEQTLYLLKTDSVGNFNIQAPVGFEGTVQPVFVSETSNAFIPVYDAATNTFTEIAGTQYKYPLSNINSGITVVDQGDGTAIALQTGDVAEYGNELVTDITVDAGSSYVDGVVTLVQDGGNDFALTDASVVSGKGYVLEYTVVSNTLVNASAFNYADSSGANFTPIPYTVGSHSVPFVADFSDQLEFIIRTDSSGNEIVFENVSVKETSNALIPVFDAATNLIDYASNVVSYPIDEQDGVEFYDNVNFVSGSDEWAVSTGGVWTFGIGYAEVDGTQVAGSYLSQPKVTVGANVVVDLVFESPVVGSVFVSLTNGGSAQYVPVGATSFTYRGVNTVNTSVYVYADVGAEAKLSLFSVKENNLNVLAYDENGARWEGVEAWREGEIVALATATSRISNPQITLLQGRTYLVSGMPTDVKANAGGGWLVDNGLMTMITDYPCAFRNEGAGTADDFTPSVYEVMDAVWTPDADHSFTQL